MPNQSIIPIERIENKIYLVRKRKVMLDADLSELYGVDTKVLNQAVKRNKERFPEDFMFQISEREYACLRSHIVTSNDESQAKISKNKRGGRRYLPFAFTEQGVAMLSSVLHSKRAVLVNIQIMRAFVRLREIIISHKELARKLDDLENKYDAQFKVVFDAIRQLMMPPQRPIRKIGFRVDDKE
jgi:hypothetical protein